MVAFAECLMKMMTMRIAMSLKPRSMKRFVNRGNFECNFGNQGEGLFEMKAFWFGDFGSC